MPGHGGVRKAGEQRAAGALGQAAHALAGGVEVIDGKVFNLAGGTVDRVQHVDAGERNPQQVEQQALGQERCGGRRIGSARGHEQTGEVQQRKKNTPGSGRSNGGQ